MNTGAAQQTLTAVIHQLTACPAVAGAFANLDSEGDTGFGDVELEGAACHQPGLERDACGLSGLHAGRSADRSSGSDHVADLDGRLTHQLTQSIEQGR